MSRVYEAEPVYMTPSAIELARAFIASGKPSRALSELKRYVFDNPHDHEAFYLAASALNRLGRYVAAMDAVNRCLNLSHGYIPAYKEMALAQLGLGERDEAKLTIRETLQVAPEYPEAWQACARILLANGEIANAYIAANRAVELAPDIHEGHALLGLILSYAGPSSEEEAERELRLAILVNARDTQSQELLIGILTRQGRMDEINALLGIPVAPVHRPTYVELEHADSEHATTPPGTEEPDFAVERELLPPHLPHSVEQPIARVNEPSAPAEVVMTIRPPVSSVVLQIGIGLLCISVAVSMVFYRMGILMGACSAFMIAIAVPLLVRRYPMLLRLCVGIPLAVIGMAVAQHFIPRATMLSLDQWHWKIVGATSFLLLLSTLLSIPLSLWNREDEHTGAHTIARPTRSAQPPHSARTPQQSRIDRPVRTRHAPYVNLAPQTRNPNASPRFQRA